MLLVVRVFSVTKRQDVINPNVIPYARRVPLPDVVRELVALMVFVVVECGLQLVPQLIFIPRCFVRVVPGAEDVRQDWRGSKVALESLRVDYRNLVVAFAGEH